MEHPLIVDVDNNVVEVDNTSVHVDNDSVGVQRSYKMRSDLHLPMIMLVFKDHIR